MIVNDCQVMRPECLHQIIMNAVNWTVILFIEQVKRPAMAQNTDKMAIETF